MDNATCKGKLSELQASLNSQLEGLGYSESTIARYDWVLEKLNAFMAENHLHYYTEEVGACFVDESIVLEPACRIKHVTVAIHRLDDTLNGRGYIRVHTNTPDPVPQMFHVYVEEYLTARGAEGRGLKILSVERLYIGQFLSVLESKGITSLAEINAHAIREALCEGLIDATRFSAVRRFLGFAFAHGCTETDFSRIIPRVKGRHCVPSTYSPAEITAVLACVDRTTNLGRRDYAMLVIAAKLGLRGGDIVALKSGDIDCAGNMIRIVQSKTKEPIELPLLPEVAEALADYIKNARPESTHKEVFLSHKAPYAPMCTSSLWHITAKHFEKAGIDTAGKRHGSHALRASLASSLLIEDVPYGAIQKVLGHKSSLSTRSYIDFDIERLRICALDVPKATGLFAKHLTASGR